MLPDEVTTCRKLSQVIASVFYCFTVAGLVFGFAALKPILLDSNVYSDLCRPHDERCKAQDTRLNLLFVVASSVNNVAALPMGWFLDKVGPRTASITGGITFALGCAVFSTGFVRPYLDTYLVGYVLLALGSPAMFLAQFHLSNAFPARSGLILGAITGGFDASSLPLVFYKVGYFSLGHKPSVNVFFLCYTIIPVSLILQQITFGPSEVYARPSSPPIDPIAIPNHHAPTSPFYPIRPGQSPSRTLSASHSPMTSPLLSSRRMSSSFSRVSYPIPDEADEEQIKLVLEGRGQGVNGNGSGIVGVMFGKSVREQVGSGWWRAMEFMVVVHMTRLNWYMTTVNTQLIYYTGQTRLADTLTDAFIFLLPSGGIVSIPAVGYLLDTRPTLHVILIMSLLSFFFGILTLLSGIVPQFIGIGLLVVFRPLFYTAISDFAAKVFGFQTFGTVYGLAMAISGLFGLVLTPLDILTKTTFHGSYNPANIALLVLGLISSLILAGKVWKGAGGIKLEDVEDSDNAIVEEDEDA